MKKLIITLFSITLFLFITHWVSVEEVLAAVDNSPNNMKKVIEMAISWLDHDDKQNIIADNQDQFSKLNDQYHFLNYRNQLTAQNTQAFLQNNYLQVPSTIPHANANEVSFSVIASGQLVNKPNNNNILSNATNNNQTQDAIQKYLANAAGAFYSIPQSDPSWKTSKEKLKYQNYYNTLAAIQSFDMYVMSSLVKSNEKTQTVNTLIDKASQSDWFLQVKNESLGLVLRDLLMYASQSYVTLARILEVQEKQLVASAMTNTLLIIAADNSAGSQLQQKAKMVPNQ